MPLFIPEPKHYKYLSKRKRSLIAKVVRKYKSAIMFFIILLTTVFTVILLSQHIL